jgi:Asp-tRNA(Asn)/Glu-tRNA(Gln) amidotransferase C subunit
MVPKFKITPALVERYAEMFDIAMSEKELTEMPGQLAGGFAGIAELWQVDVTGCEPATIFPVDRSAKK